VETWNLSEPELLLTISELTIAFAGFASLASILGRSFSKDDPRVDAGRLLNMLTASLSLTFLALIPFLPMLLGWSSRWVWGASGIVGLAAVASISPSVIRRTSQMKQFAGFNPLANILNHALFIAAVVGFLCSAFGIPRVNPFVAYFASIVTLLASCAILFFRVIASLLQPTAPSAE
jgi:hypothetical protein